MIQIDQNRFALSLIKADLGSLKSRCAMFAALSSSRAFLIPFRRGMRQRLASWRVIGLCKFLKTLNFRFLILFCSECGSVKVELRSRTLLNVSVGRGMSLYTQGLHFTIMLEWESYCSAVLEAPKSRQSSAVSLAKQGKGFLAGSFLPWTDIVFNIVFTPNWDHICLDRHFVGDDSF